MSEERKKKFRWMPVMLAVSLACNLLVVGVIAGTALRFRDGGGVRFSQGFGPALYRALPDRDRKAFRSELADRHKHGARGRSQDLKALSQALRSVPFDAEEVQVLIESKAQERADVHKALNQIWLVRVTEMSDEERSAYADRLEEIMAKGHRHWKKQD